MSAHRTEEMRGALKRVAVPVVRELGFRGPFPHFSRRGPERIDLLTFQFSLYGPSLYVEAAECGPEGVTLGDGRHFSPERVRAHHTASRIRLGCEERQFDFGPEHGAGVFEANATSIAKLIREQTEQWWRGDTKQPARADAVSSRGPASTARHRAAPLSS